MRSLYLLPLSAVALLLPVPPVNGLSCPLQVTDAGEESVALCAMCSQSNAAVRWTFLESVDFKLLRLGYTCSYPNGTVIYEEDGYDPIEDTCFAPPNWVTSHTGVSAVGYELWTGVECKFIILYRINADTIEKNVDCIVKSPATCAASPDDCQVDRISVMNEEEQCPEYHCAAGYSGELCNNVNECETNNTCHEHAECHDTDGSYLCVCRAGFMGDGYNCTDIDECLNETCGENAYAHCVNTVGTFSCQCDEGFTGDGYNCSDVNECETNNTCHEHAECHDTDGSYLCVCRAGFMGDGYNCTDIDECLNETCGENAYAHCVNTVGAFSCQCDEGFTGDGYNCSDIDECLDSLCHEMAKCTNTGGSFECECQTGYNGDGHECLDINECDLEDRVCGENAHCNNTAGSYVCECNAGLQNDGFTNCIDIDECKEGSFTCPVNTTCTNLLGKYRCDYNSLLADSSVDLVAVVSGGVGVVLLILILTIAVIVAYFYTHKLEKPSFQELTKMDLDPDYTPFFWRGSLASVHSKYEILDFSDLKNLTTDITHSENDETRRDIQDDQASINIVNEVNALVPPTEVSSTQGEPLQQPRTTDYRVLEEPSAMLNDVQKQDQFLTLTTNTSSTSSIAINIDAGSISDILTTLEDDTIRAGVLDTKMIIENFTSAVDIPTEDIRLKTTPCHQQHVMTASSGYITNAPPQHDPAESQQRVYPEKGCASNDSIGELKTDSTADQTDKDRNGDRTDYVADSSTCSSGYITESVMSGLLSNYDTQQSCSSNTLEQDDQLDNKGSLQYVASSRCASESATGDSECVFKCRSYSKTERSSQHSEHPASTHVEIDSGCNYVPNSPSTSSSSENTEFSSQTSLKLTDIEVDLDSVKFTVNAHQQFDYVNAIEENLFKDVCFDIAP